MNDDDGLISFDDAYAIGMKICEMVDRVRVVDLAAKGTLATSHISIDGTRYKIVVSVER